MGFTCGIVGLPNVGKSTLFNALTRTAAAQAANYPFCTIEPNTGEVAVPDPRLDRIAAIAKPAAVVPTRISFVLVALWWAFFSVPLFRKVKEPDALVAGGLDGWWNSFARVGATLSDLRKYPQAMLLLLAFLLYNDGIQTIIRMATIYGEELGLDRNLMIAAIVMVQFVGIPFAFLFGALAGWIGTKRAIFIALSVYSLATILGYFMTTVTHFFILAALIATVQGGAQALSRSLFSRLIPPDQSSEFFGFFAVAERFATILGPLVFTLSIAITGSSRTAILAILLFFVAGAWVLSKVKEP